MGNALMIPENLLAQVSANVIANTQASASMADDNLLTESPSKFWRSLDNWQTSTWMLLSVGSYSTVKASAMALVGHNFYRGSQARVICMAGGSAINPDFQELVPTGTYINQSNCSSTNLGLIDEGQAGNGGADQITYAAPGSWYITVPFNNPSSAPKTGAHKQVFWALMRPTNDASYQTSPVTVTCDLYQDILGVSTLVRTLGTKALQNNTNIAQRMFWTWDAAELAASSGNDVQCRITVTPGGGGENASLDSLVWICERASDPNSAAIYDSGWLTFSDDIGSSPEFKPNGVGAGSAWLIQFGATYSFGRLYLILRSDNAPADFDATKEVAKFPPGYVQIGTVVLGETFSTTVNMGYGKLAGGVDTSPKKRTYGGQMFGSRRPVRRVVSLRLGHMTPAECHTIFDRLVWRHGVMKPFLISLLPDDATQSKHTTVFAALRNPENWVNIQPEQGYENNMEMDFEEVL